MTGLIRIIAAHSMGPEVLIIMVSYNVAALMALIHTIGLVPRRTRMWSAIILVISAIAAVMGYFTAPPHWEQNTAVLNFALAAVALTILAVGWALGAFVIRRFRHWPQKHAV